MQMSQTTLTVRGVEVPRIGFGTFQLSESEAETGVRDALAMGYRHVDTARAYANERGVGRALADAGVPREQIFLTTKVRPADLAADAARSSVESSLRDLDTDYVDLILIHWPNPDVPLAETLDTLAKLREEGKVRHLGVSNFPSGLLRQALDLAPIITNQIEYHPYLVQPRLLALMREADLMLTAYGPMAKGKVHGDPVLNEIASAHGVTPAQVALRWLVQQPNVVTLPRSTSPANRAANLDVFGFTLSDDEVARISALDEGLRLYNPPWAPDWDA
jgi:2,5-diketo-D-gluconate reductase B